MRSIRFTAVLMLLLVACDRKAVSVVYQYAAFDAFAAGEYAGQVPLAALKAHGDFGLGTVNGLAGEMIILDGVFYVADEKCRLSRADPATLSPFAELTFFKPDASEPVGALGDMAAVGKFLDARLPEGSFAAARVTGRFTNLTIRSVPGFIPPYPPLGEALKSQRVLELKDVSGTLVGLRGPEMRNGVWVPGWHFHFVATDGKTGGHVLNGDILDGEAAWMVAKRFELELPRKK